MAAATASPHRNNAVLNQNGAQASTKITRAKLCRSRGRLVSDAPVILRVDENIFFKLHRCQPSLTAMRMTTFTWGTPPGLYAAAHRLIDFKDR